VALLATLMVCIPLGLASFSMTTKSRIEDRIEATIARIPEHILHIEDVRVFRDKDCYVAEMTVYLHNQVDAEEVRDLPAYIARQTNARVRLRATMVKADFQEIGMDPGVEEPSGAGDERLPEGLDSGEASPIGGEDQGAKTTPGRLHKAKTLQM